MNLMEIEAIRVSNTATHKLLRLYDRLEDTRDKTFKRSGKSHKFYVCEEYIEKIRNEVIWRHTKSQILRSGG